MTEHLRTLSVDDLNQRYGRSYVRYDGKPLYIYSFLSTDIISTGFEGITEQGFNFDLFDTYRPPSQWIIPDGYPFYVSRTIEKQWCRGFNHKSYTYYTPASIFVSIEGLGNFMFNPLPTTYKKIPLLRNSSYIVNQHMLVYADYIYYRKYKIAKILLDNRIYCLKSTFQQEILDAFLDVQFVTIPQEYVPTIREPLPLHRMVT